MEKNKELIKNTIIILLGKFCTQFLSFFLLPLYTTIILFITIIKAKPICLMRL